MKAKFIAIIALCVIVVLTMTGCSYTSTQQDMQNTRETANLLAERQPTPTDIEYSLERYNLTRRAYWVWGEDSSLRS